MEYERGKTHKKNYEVDFEDFCKSKNYEFKYFLRSLEEQIQKLFYKKRVLKQEISALKQEIKTEQQETNELVYRSKVKQNNWGLEKEKLRSEIESERLWFRKEYTAIVEEIQRLKKEKLGYPSYDQTELLRTLNFKPANYPQKPKETRSVRHSKTNSELDEIGSLLESLKKEHTSLKQRVDNLKTNEMDGEIVFTENSDEAFPTTFNSHYK